MSTFSSSSRRYASGEQLRKSPLIRCAIYTRKSSEEGLEQEFNSLDAQRESGEAYIASQKAEGWVCLPDKYDDGGYTGGNMERPAVRRLMADIDAGKVDCVVVYKVDRLSSSLMDFARMMEVFDRKKISFVSVTQQFNTTQSMGRLTLNILLSFAQFEREIISELLTGPRKRAGFALRPGRFPASDPSPGNVGDSGRKRGSGLPPRSLFGHEHRGSDRNPKGSRRALGQTSQTLSDSRLTPPSI
jgi:site-specific DNA recombinase